MNTLKRFEGLLLDDRKLVVGIDFGTTFSGVAWAETRRADQHSIIEIWPATLGTHEGTSSVKTPSELRYTTKGIEWGFQIPASVERYQWFKLGLADGKAPAAGQKSSEELTTDYLTELYKHLMYTLEQKLGASILRTVPLEFCLTVPAIWSEVAKEKTLKACQNAGFTSDAEILLVSEPEAAAIYSLHGLDPHGLKIGDSFVLCDSGGGTVDLISYTITELRPILRVKEAASGTGGLCGSAFLNRQFQNFLTSKLGAEPGWDDEILAEAVDRFDSVTKKQYSPQTSGQDGYTFLVAGLADNSRLGIRRGRYTVKPAEMRDIFEPVIMEIIKLVQKQIKATSTEIRSLLLVGGFGQNNYLKDRLRASLKGVEVLQPPNAWTSIVRGAVMMGLSRANKSLTSVAIASRSARKHYGIELNVPYKPEIHDESKKYWSKKYGLWEVPAMRWFINKGDPVEENKPYEITFSHYFPCDSREPRTTKISVLCDSVSNRAPVHQDSNVRMLARLQADLSHLSEGDLASTITTRNDGKKCYRISASVEATFLSASTKYVLLCHGERYDTISAEYV